MITVIIPTLNEASIIESSLSNLLNSYGDFEVIVADGGSTDGTRDIVNQFPEVRQVVSARGRAGQMNEGARVATGDTFLFLHADTKLPTNAFQTIQEVMSDTSTVGGCLCLSFDHGNFLLKVYSLFSRINHLLFTYGDQGLFVRSSTFREIGGFKDIPIMEDVEIQKRLRSMGRFAKIRSPVVTSARRFVRCGIARQQVRNTVLVLLYHLGAAPPFLKTLYSDSSEISR